MFPGRCAGSEPPAAFLGIASLIKEKKHDDSFLKGNLGQPTRCRQPNALDDNILITTSPHTSKGGSPVH